MELKTGGARLKAYFENTDKYPCVPSARGLVISVTIWTLAPARQAGDYEIGNMVMKTY